MRSIQLTAATAENRVRPACCELPGSIWIMRIRA